MFKDKKKTPCICVLFQLPYAYLYDCSLEENKKQKQKMCCILNRNFGIKTLLRPENIPGH